MCWLADGRPVLRCYPGKALALVFWGGRAEIRILVAFEESYRIYRETIAAALRVLRPETEVKSTILEELEGELERFDPQVVICSGHKEIEPGIRLAWIELSMDPTMPNKISVGGRHYERTNPTMEELLKVIEEVG
jgi:hypothetical protein